MSGISMGSTWTVIRLNHDVDADQQAERDDEPEVYPLDAELVDDGEQHGHQDQHRRHTLDAAADGKQEKEQQDNVGQLPQGRSA